MSEDTPKVNTHDEIAALVDRYIQPWQWAAGYAAVEAVLGLVGGTTGIHSASMANASILERFAYDITVGALLGGLYAYALRAVIKAIRCRS